MTQQVEEKQRISTRDLAFHDRSVAEVVVNAVNNYGVRIKIIDGSHFMLYNGDPNVRPEKISKSRPKEETTNRLLRWLSRNVPGWDDRKVGEEDLAALRDRFNGPADEPEPTDPEPEPTEPETPWVDAISTSGKDWGFETNGTVWRCKHPGCKYQQTEARGLHLHAVKHTEEPGKLQSAAADTRRERRERNKRAVQQSLVILAAAHGFTLADDETIKAAKETAKLRAEVEKITKERDEAVARLALIQEAMRA